MPSTRLFHTLVVAGAALVSAPLVACAGNVGTETPTTQSPSSPDDDGDDDIDLGKPLGKPVDGKADGGTKPAADAGQPDTGWAPTK